MNHTTPAGQSARPRPATSESAATREELLGIAEAAAVLGVTPRTLRFYEDKGLIQPQRVGTMRVYSRREMGRMRLILRGKRLGFSIREIAEFLSLYDSEHGQQEQMRLLLARVQQRLAQLQRQREALEETIGELEAIEQQVQAHLAKA